MNNNINSNNNKAVKLRHNVCKFFVFLLNLNPNLQQLLDKKFFFNPNNYARGQSSSNSFSVAGRGKKIAA